VRLQILAADGRVILDARSDACAVEVGGGPWEETWEVAKEFRGDGIARFISLVEGNSLETATL